MKLSSNPFCVLRLPCSSGRREIMSASEELSFTLDSDACLSAQNDLINLGKRLTAEIGWFPDLDKDSVIRIQERIDANEELATDGLTQISKLNATLYNFAISKETDLYEIGYEILDIDEQYSALDIAEITSTINKNRESAKIALVQEKDVSNEINKKRDDIRQIITEQLSTINQDSYIELITTIAEKCIADEDFEDGVVLADVVDQYEVRMQSLLETQISEIESNIESIKELSGKKDKIHWDGRNGESGISTMAVPINNEINSLIELVKSWDIIAQPLQLKSQASGMPHEISESLGHQLRNLALYLHNENGRTKEALTLVDAMKDVFAELDGLAELFDSDSDALNDLIQGEEEAKAVLSELDAIQKQGESLKTFSTTTSVNAFVDRVKKLDKKLKTINLDAETRKKVRENLCYMARSIAIDLHNTRQKTSDALTIARALASEFSDMPSLALKLNQDVATLNQQLVLSLGRNVPSRSYSTPSRSSSNSSNPGCLIAIAIIVVIIIIAAIAGGGNSSSSKSSTTTSKPSSSYSQNSGNTGNNSSSYGGNNSSSNKNSTTTPTSNTITLSKSNFETYFNLTTDAEFIDNKVTISYSITPKSSTYSKESDSSDKIEVEIGAVVSMLQYYYGEPDYNKKYTVTLNKSQNYTASGSFSLTYSSFSDTVYWQADVTSCSGKIGK